MRRFLGGLNFRLFAAFTAVIVLTLTLAGLALYVLIDDYREQVAASTLRSVAAPFYDNLFREASRGGEGAVRIFLQEQDEESDIVTLLVNSEGTALSATSSGVALIGETLPLPPLPPQRPVDAQTRPRLTALLREQEERSYTAEDGTDYIYLVAPLPFTSPAVEAQDGYAIVIAIEEDSSDEIVDELRPPLFRAGLIGLLAAIFIAFVVSRSVLRPLARVVRGARAVGSGDYDTHVEVKGPAEVKELAASFNTMTEAVKGSQRTTRDFLANISHELKTPLTSIRGFAQAMLDGTLTEGEGRERAARVIDAETRRLLYLVQELLDLSRLESGQAPLRFERVQLHELFNQLADIFSLRAAESDLELRVSPPPSELALRGDFDRLEQVLGNLLDNAFRHTRTGFVSLSARAEDSDIEILVEDSGEGILPNDLDRIFDRFYQSQGRSGEGSGLGLAISREIVRAHGGDIRAENRPEGGTRMVISLPAA